MKYLLILLFLFSTHSFSGEIDGKGLVCDVWSKRWGDDEVMYWFNNNKVAWVNIIKGFKKTPKGKRLWRTGEFIHEYYLTDEEVRWKQTSLRNYYVDRKTLKIKSQFDGKTDFTGDCEVFEDFEEVKIYQDKLEAKIRAENEEYLRDLEEKRRKAKEGNKL